MNLYVSTAMILAVLAIYYHIAGVDIPLVSLLVTRKAKAVEKIVLGSLAIALSIGLFAVIFFLTPNPGTSNVRLIGPALVALFAGVERLCDGLKRIRKNEE